MQNLQSAGLHLHVGTWGLGPTLCRSIRSGSLPPNRLAPALQAYAVGDHARPPDHWARPSMAHPSMKPRRTVMKKFALSNLLALTLALGVVASTGLPAQADAPLVTVTGTVVSIVDEVLVVSTDRGNLTFDLDKNTEMPANIAVGNRITVSYDSDDKPEDKMDARKIVMAPASTAVTPV